MAWVRRNREIDARSAREKAYPLLTVAEAAAFLGVHATTLRDWQKQDKIIPALITRSGRYFYTELRLSKFLNKGAVSKAKAALEKIARRRAANETGSASEILNTSAANAEATSAPKLLTSKQASQILGIRQKTLYAWRTEGTFVPYVTTPTGVARYSEEQVKSFKREDVREMVRRERRSRLSPKEFWKYKLQQDVCLGRDLIFGATREKLLSYGVDPDRTPAAFLGKTDRPGRRIRTKPLTTAQAARFLNYPAGLLKVYADTGVLEPCYFTMSGQPRYTEAQLMAFSPRSRRRISRKPKK